MSFKSVNHADSDGDLGGAAEAADESAAKAAVEAAKRALGAKVKDVRLSKRLAKSPSCVVMDKDDPTLQYRELMMRLGNTELPEASPILEINPSHALVKKFAALEERRAASPDDAALAQDLDDLANILLDQALLSEGQKFVKPADFIERLNRQLARG
jgi:molecular chaperone HtpG